MITRITKENVDKYRALFADAVYALQTHDSEGNLVTEKAGNEPVFKVEVTYKELPELTEEDYEDGFHYIKNSEGQWELTQVGEVFKPEQEYAMRIETSEQITTLEEYFCHIADLYAISKKYTLLPLINPKDVEDEENFFKIDANTRKITVPKAFEKNGISVQGDEIAEIVYFKIDRFYDMDDLGEKSVYIEWRLPADAEGVQKQGVSVPYFVDANIEPGYVIIGWPIRSELTKIPGKIEFAVRFYTIPDEGPNSNKVMYSFSTIPAFVEVKPSLNLNIADIALEGSALNSEDIIGSRIENSDKDDINTPDPVTPVFFEKFILPANYIEVENDGNEQYKTFKVFLTDKETGVESDGLYAVYANVTDSGRLSYMWIKRNSEGKIFSDYAGGNASAFVKVAKEATVDTKKSYYVKKNENSYTPFVATETIPTVEAALAADIDIFEHRAEIILNCSAKDGPVLGTYQARAINRLGHKTARAFSDIVLIEGPEVPEITKQPGQRAIFEGEAADAAVSVEVKADEHAYTNYILYRVLEDGDAEITSNTTGEFIIDGKAYDETNKDADLGDGFYYVIINSKLNSVTKSVTSEQIRVTHKASPVTITNSEPTYNVGSIIKYDVNAPISVSVELHPSEKDKRIENVDKIEYQWYIYRKPSEEDFIHDVDAAEKGLYEVSDIDVMIEGATEATLKIENTAGNESDLYFCCVTNIYNNDKKATCSNFFEVIDATAQV